MGGGSPPDCNGDQEGPSCDESVADGPRTAAPPDDAFDLLADDRVRYVLYLLDAFGGTTSIDELATGIAAREEEVEPEAVDEDARDRVRTELYHADVPKLATEDVVDFDLDTMAVTMTDCAACYEPYLEFAKEREPMDVEGFVEQCQEFRR